MSRAVRFLGSTAILGLVLAGCASTIVQKEDLLAAAGFASKPAVTTQQITALKRLPPHRFVHQMHNGQLVWLYADPSVCGCVYAGSDTAYAAYRREVFAKNLADEQQQSAEMNDDAAMQQNIDWGSWGGGGPWGTYNY